MEQNKDNQPQMREITISAQTKEVLDALADLYRCHDVAVHYWPHDMGEIEKPYMEYEHAFYKVLKESIDAHYYESGFAEI